MENNNKIQSLNSVLPEFYLDDMERRLETDPLTIGLVDLDMAEETCEGYSSCQCDVHNGACIDKISCNKY
jgi:hypothetical protein